MYILFVYVIRGLMRRLFDIENSICEGTYMLASHICDSVGVNDMMVSFWFVAMIGLFL